MTMQIYKGTAPKRPSDLLKYELNAEFCRSGFTLLAGSGAERVVKMGELLAQSVTAGAAAVAADAGNTGDGTLFMDVTTPIGAIAQEGNYIVECIGGDFDGVIAADAGNTGNGAGTMHMTKTAEGVKAGVYTVTFIEPVSNLGTFQVEDPDGTLVGTGVVGTLFDNVIKFTIADGAADFVAGDIFRVTVSAVVPTDGGLFSVSAPDGSVLANATVGVAYAGTHIQFTIADGAIDFALGDKFTVSLSGIVGKAVAWAPGATDGTEVIWGIALKDIVASDGADAAGGLGLLRGPALLFQGEIVWPSGITLAQKATALAKLEARNILVR